MIFLFQQYYFDDQDFLGSFVEYGGQGIFVIEGFTTATMIVVKAATI